MQPLEIGPGDEVAADFGVLGRVSLRFAGAA
jgi:2-keto-4-pentenoate hydratase